jgi:hypothetical protein
MASEWFVRGGGKVYGPLDSSKLRQLVADGKINESTDVSQSQSGPWSPAGKVRGLFGNATPPQVSVTVSPPRPAPTQPSHSAAPANDAPGAITRMIDMGVPAYLVASSVIAVLAQRLVRVNCTKCKQPFQPLDSQIETAGITPEMLKGATFMKGRGCAHCQKSGYKGRLGIFELMVMSNKIRELTFQGAPTQELRRAAVSDGMSVMFHDGIAKVLRGITTLDEIFRVAKQVEG